MSVIHQDWDTVVFKSNPKQPVVNKTKPKQLSSDEEIKIEQPKQLGQLILQARTTCNKTQKVLANDLGIAVQILSRWETNKEYPDNKQISNIEKILKIKLPRSKKKIVSTA